MGKVDKLVATKANGRQSIKEGVVSTIKDILTEEEIPTYVQMETAVTQPKKVK